MALMHARFVAAAPIRTASSASVNSRNAANVQRGSQSHNAAEVQHTARCLAGCCLAGSREQPNGSEPRTFGGDESAE